MSSASRAAFIKSLGSLIKLLPTGTVFAFQFLNPLFTNNGDCRHPVYKCLTGVLLFAGGFFCAFASFTDSYPGSDGRRHYGVVIWNGIWPTTASDGVDLRAYRLRFWDFVHASFAVLVFAVLGLLDPNTVQCFYPHLESKLRTLLPLLVALVSGLVFGSVPNKRHGIGYPASSDQDNTNHNVNNNGTATS